MQIRQKGFLLPIILIIMIILSILGMSLLGRWQFDAKTEVNAENNMQAYYLARSGVEITKVYLVNHKTALLAKANGSRFYFTGLFENNNTPATINVNTRTSEYIYKGSNSINVLVNVIKTGSRTFSVTATGIYKGQQNKLQSDITFGSAAATPAELYNADGSPAVITIPTVNNPSVQDAASSIVQFIHLDPNGNIYNGITTADTTTGTTSGTVIQSVVYPSTVSIALYASEAYLKTRAMYFSYTPLSLTVNQNKSLHLYADFLAFYGSVEIDAPNGSNTTDLELKVFNSDLSGTVDSLKGSDIFLSTTTGYSSIKDSSYGLVYFGNTVKYDNTTVRYDYQGSTYPLSGYYFFKDGVNLASQSDCSVRTNLCPANDLVIKQFNLASLGIQSQLVVGSGITTVYQ